jgi:uncharacterized repeat protein (TIGR03803 family)
MSTIKWGQRACGIFLLWATAAVALPAQTFISLHSFDVTDGNAPVGALVQGTDGNLYGATGNGGATGAGTFFEITPSGTLKTLHSFHVTDGEFPEAAPVQGTDGNFYGTTVYGGAIKANNDGTVFRITPSGTLTTLHSFDVTDGQGPDAALVQRADGNFYGTTQFGGAHGAGTVFNITASGTLTTLYSFCPLGGHCADGAFPSAGLIQAADGNFYGTTEQGGTSAACAGIGCGTVFKINPSGTLTTLYGFCALGGNCVDGAYPFAGLVQGTDGNFYGTTQFGGANDVGTVFEITPSGALTTLHSFDGADGSVPYAGLILGTDGNFYGTTEYGANDACFDSCGTVFKITPGGKLTTLHSFDSTDGKLPLAGLVQGTNGKFYGTTYIGGTSTAGTVFSLSVGLRQFVETQPIFGTVGEAVNILGTNLTGATSVTFNGTAATFTVVSRSLITTTVPAGATAGTVQVTGSGGTLSSNVPFTVN